MGDEDTILTEYFESLGFKTLILTILLDGNSPGKPASQWDAIVWGASHDITNDILWDAKGTWGMSPFTDMWPGDGFEGARGTPQWFIVDTKTMLIWDSPTGYAPDMHTTSYLSDILDLCKDGSGWAPDSDAGVDGGIDAGI
ncbi:MAG: hypothetical protein PHU25_06575 [Deltaproteobacteria bacterium]|nr:hypothetical protein [Deltaproteobacteria bacterium]